VVGRPGLSEQIVELGWHVISGKRLLEMLRRVSQGEDPDLVYAEEWANAEHDYIPADGNDDE